MTLLPVPHSCDLCVPHLLLQLEDTVHQRFRRWRASRNVNVHRHDPVAPSRDRVAVVVVSATICAATHRDDPPRVGHLVVHLPQRRSHLIGKGAGNNHYVGLPRRSAEDYTQSVLVVAGCGEMHHFDGAAGETESHRPERALSRPIGHLVERRPEKEC
jgi:hypothetical protein